MDWQGNFSQSERDDILATLTDNQKKFIKDYLKRGRRTVFANVLANDKASSSDDRTIEKVAQSWQLEDYIDAGPDWQKHSQLYCQCGRRLRYQYIVQNMETGEVKMFGINHFEDHFGIPPKLVKEIKNGIAQIDFEMDEVLAKITSGWTLADEGIAAIPPSIEIPKDIQEHVDHDIPLLDRQVKRLKGRLAEYNREKEKRRLEALAREKEAVEEIRQKEATQHRQEIAASNASAKTSSDIFLEHELQIGVLAILNHLPHPQFSAMGICHELIKHHGASNEMYSSGKPRIFSNVCIFLEHLKNQGVLELVEKQGVEDRIYRKVEEIVGAGSRYEQGTLF
ncbi:DUF3895 domain-containing protein [Aquibacillus sediminis]|uniref:DUF3895 domain-containing protein n=1 Tax=Aquibacillus sediminis TaxID=2574734 RepID=UPI001485D602|nr:DUF3895 domain-containing protein [Aquibacillus sediminis]